MNKETKLLFKTKGRSSFSTKKKSLWKKACCKKDIIMLRNLYSFGFLATIFCRFKSSFIPTLFYFNFVPLKGCLAKASFVEGGFFWFVF